MLPPTISKYIVKGYDFSIGIVYQGQYEGLYTAWLESGNNTITKMGDTIETVISNLEQELISLDI